MRWALMISAVSLAPLACSPHGQGRCDLPALGVAARASVAAMATWRPESGERPHDYEIAGRGVLDACPGLLPWMGLGVPSSIDDRSPALMRDVDDETRGLWLAACPDVLTLKQTEDRESVALLLYDRCDLALQGLVSREEVERSPELGSWIFDAHILNAWLIEGGAAPAIARALVRPLITRQRAAFAEGDLEMRLAAVAKGEPSHRDETELLVSPERLKVHPRRSLRLSRAGSPLSIADGDPLEGMKLVAELRQVADAETTAGPEGEPPRLRLAIDPRVPWSKVAKLITRAQATGWTSFDLRALGPDPFEPDVQVPLHDLDPAAEPSNDLFVTATEVFLRDPGQGVERTSLHGLRAALDAPPDAAVRLWISADVRWQRALDIITSLPDRIRIVALESTISSMYARLRECSEIDEQWLDYPTGVGFVSDHDAPAWFVFRLRPASPELAPGEVVRLGEPHSVHVEEIRAPSDPSSQPPYARRLRICRESTCEWAVHLAPGQRLVAGDVYSAHEIEGLPAKMSAEFLRLSELRLDGVPAETWLADDPRPRRWSFISREFDDPWVEAPTHPVAKDPRAVEYEVAERWAYPTECEDVDLFNNRRPHSSETDPE